MRLGIVVLWLAATVLAGYNVYANADNGMWMLITLLFAANAFRQAALYLKEKKGK